MAQNNASNDSMNDENKNNDKNQSETYTFSIGSFNVWCPHWNGSESKHPQIWKKRHNDIINILVNNDNNNNKNDKQKKADKTDTNEDKNNDDDDNNNNNSNTLPPMNCDIYCLQEFWCDREPFVRIYDNYFKARNYELHFLKRSAKHKPDGIAILINKDTFKLINKINYKYTISNRVAIMMELQHLKSKCSINIGNTHLTFPQELYDADIRAVQCNQFIDLLNKKTSNSVSTMMLCGDFNCQIDETEAVLCVKDGYKSSYHVCNPHIKGDIVSHINHEQQAVFVDHIFYKNNPKVSKDHSFMITPIESYLYPKNMDISSWCNDWILSDHRPIVSTFEIKNN